MIELNNSQLLALSKDKNNNLSSYLIELSPSLYDKVRSSFIEGFNHFKSLMSIDFKVAEICEKDECFKTPYVLPDAVIDAIRNPLALTKVKDKDLDRIGCIKALFMGEIQEQGKSEHCKVVFKRLTPANFLSRGNWFMRLIYAQGVYNEFDSSIIAIPNKSHAIFDENCLLFDSFQTANQMLGLSEVYRVCSNDDLKKFKGNVILSGSISLEDFALTRVRRLIAIINDSEVLSKQSIEEIEYCAKEQFIDLPVKDNHIILNLDNKEQTMLILNFLAENTFITTFSKKRATTSRKKVV